MFYFLLRHSCLVVILTQKLLLLILRSLIVHQWLGGCLSGIGKGVSGLVRIFIELRLRLIVVSTSNMQYWSNFC